MKKQIGLIVLALACVLALAGCACEHEWVEADCANPKTCSKCQETEGAPLGHEWAAATCETAKTCEVCGETEGEAKGHSMVEATCAEAKHCENCDMTEGEALEHVWLEATTEAPVTCENCGETEGERIITDERFTTESTKELYGTWSYVDTMSFRDLGASVGEFDDLVDVKVLATYTKDGTMVIQGELVDVADFTAKVKDMNIKNLYYLYEVEDGMTPEEVDEMFTEYGTTIEAYVEEGMAELDMDSMIEEMMAEQTTVGIYFVEDGKLYYGESWDNIYDNPITFTVEGDTLTTVNRDVEMTMTRVAEEAAE